MRVLFFSFHNKTDIEVHPGIGVLSSALRLYGHETRLQPYFYFDGDTFTKTVNDFKPDLIGLSATHMAVEQVKHLAPFLKKITDAPVVAGGVFPILEPLAALNTEGVDAVCTGEGTEGIVEFLEGRHPAANFLYKGQTRVRKKKYWGNDPLPMIDYDIFMGIDGICEEKPKKLDFWTSHTCEFGCAFCCSRRIRKLTGLRSKPRQPAGLIIESMKKIMENMPVKKVQFRDPLFVGPNDLNWIKEFLPVYSGEIGLPYSANIRADVVNDELSRFLADTGCYLVKMGLESGSEELRNKVLKKGETNEQFIKACNNLRKAGIKISLNAMLGIPFETYDTAKLTIEFMTSLEPDKTFLHIFQPWPGLDIPGELRQYIKYMKFPALNDTIVSGRKFSNGEDGITSFREANTEYVVTPVLDQPSFPYETALKMQQDYLERTGER